MIDNTFILDAKMYVSVQKLRISVGNRIYGFLKENYLRYHPNYAQLLRRRKDKTADRKKTAKIEKEMLRQRLAESELTMTDFNDIFNINKKEHQIYRGIVTLEKEALKKLEPRLEEEQIYVNWLEPMKGIALSTSTKLLMTIRDILRFPNPSKLVKYLGLIPGQRKRRGKEADFNPKIQGLMLGVVAKNLLIQNSPYRRIYDEKKVKYHDNHPDWTKLKCHNYALKPMVRRFVVELWVAWHRSLGLEPPCNPYIVDIGKHSLKPMIVPYPHPKMLQEETVKIIA